MTQSSSVSVRASGGVVVRGPASSPEVALVHRPAYDDWTIPKGKDDPGESPQIAALREVHEETGFHCGLVGPAGVTTYQVPLGLKRVEYFLMRPIRHAGFVANAEVDAVRWVSLTTAAEQLSYQFDRELISGLDVATAAAHTTLHLVRHGAAGNRERWERPDEERPLTAKGRGQAAAVAAALGPLRPERILSSPYLRCIETVEPLAHSLDLGIKAHAALAEGANRGEISRLLDDVAGTTAVLCSHGDVIPTTLDMLRSMGVELRSPYECKKGSTWTVGHDGTRYTEAAYWGPG